MRGDAGGTGVDEPAAFTLDDRRKLGVLVVADGVWLALACRASPAPLKFIEDAERGGKGSPKLLMFCVDCEDCIGQSRHACSYRLTCMRKEEGPTTTGHIPIQQALGGLVPYGRMLL